MYAYEKDPICPVNPNNEHLKIQYFNIIYFPFFLKKK